MRILIAADLHYDMWAAGKIDPFAVCETLLESVDHVLLADDLTNKPKVRWKLVFQRLIQHVAAENISVIPGNHDFYDFQFDGEDRLRRIAEDHGARYAQMKELRFHGVRVLCPTLWTDLELGRGYALNRRLVPQKKNDYRYIRIAGDRYRKLSPDDVVLRHRAHRAWLEDALAQPFDGETWVATHHAPHPDVLTGYAGDVGAAYASDLGDLIRRRQPARWFYGHCHYGRTIDIGRTRVQNVSVGTPYDTGDPGGRLQTLVFDTPSHPL